MPLYTYRARDEKGSLISGETEAADEGEVMTLLSGRGLMPLAIKKGSPGFDLAQLEKMLQPGVTGEEILVMTRQFYTLFKAGMSMEAILSTLIRQTQNKVFQGVLQDIQNSVAGGDGLSKAFGKHRKVFGELYVSMLSAGEEAGILELVLGNIAGLLEKEMKIKGSVKSATLYPKIVVFVLICASVVIMSFVMPKFESFFSHYKAELPLPTRIMIGTSAFLHDFWYMLLGGVAGIVTAYRKYANTAKGKIKLGALAFKLPVFGPLNTKVANSRFCHILAALYRSGLPINRCLEIAGSTIDNGAFAKEMDVLRAEVTRGRTLSESMAECHYFTPVIVDATAVGEKTGALDEMLESMGMHYDMEVEHSIKNLTTMLEPMLLGGIFGIVTVFMLAIFLPMWNMSTIVNKH